MQLREVIDRLEQHRTYLERLYDKLLILRSRRAGERRFLAILEDPRSREAYGHMVTLGMLLEGKYPGFAKKETAQLHTVDSETTDELRELNRSIDALKARIAAEPALTAALAAVTYTAD